MSAALNRKLREAEQRLQQADPAGAQELCEQVLRAAPRNPAALFLLAMARLAQGMAADALPLLERVTAIDSRHGSAFEHLGLAALMLGRFADAERALRKAAAMPGAPASVSMRLGLAILEQDRVAEALPLLQRAAALDRHDADAHLNLGRALAATGDITLAKREFEAALELAPRYAPAAYNLALAALTLGRLGEAIEHLRTTARLEPQNAMARATLAAALFEAGQLDEAEAEAKAAIGADSSAAGGYATLANVHLVRDELAQTISVLEAGHGSTGDSSLLGMLTYQLRQACDWDKWRTAWETMAPLIETSDALSSPFWLLCEPTTAQQQLHYASRWSAARFHGLTPVTGASVRAPRSGQRLRVGYLSSDLQAHATAYLMAEVFEHHDRDRFEIFAYSYGPDDRSAMRQRLRAACEHFVDISREPDDTAAERIRTDSLDVLVDLKGYTVGDRLAIMARRPCGIQLTWLGYPGTTGAGFIDYAIADAVVVPPSDDNHYSERILRLPHCYQPNDRKRAVAAVLPREAYGLPSHGFVFCCFNQTYKITPEVFAAWMRLLRDIPEAVLWLFESHALAKRNLLRHAERHGVAPGRIVFAPKLPNADHLARYRAADLALDTFPYTSHTTMSDALWCECPALALCGDTFASRVSTSIATAAGMPDLVTHSLEQYERLAAELATDPQRLAALKIRLAQARRASPLFDSMAVTRALESLYAGVVDERDQPASATR